MSALPLLILLLACGDDQGPSEALSLTDLDAGTYRFHTLSVRDGCLDGALEVLFMPEGPDSAHPFEHLIPIPAASDLPASYPVDFRAPFVGMDVTVTAQGETLVVDGAPMVGVALGGASGDCAVDMEADVRLTRASATELQGSATLTVGDPRGAQGLCPVFDQDPCAVDLILSATLE
ncbi:MAG: hypothetical protein JXX28_02875 [Deltaproteobacteria bacterium]|nr:hypothetical protein [Deltaproteobacteria bacterium]